MSLIQVSPSMLEKGWRCLDCTVCEGCGKPHDESRLILCDECDISFHIYCLDPPLEEVPQVVIAYFNRLIHNFISKYVVISVAPMGA